jgi:hypothetical protein
MVPYLGIRAEVPYHGTVLGTFGTVRTVPRLVCRYGTIPKYRTERSLSRYGTPRDTGETKKNEGEERRDKKESHHDSFFLLFLDARCSQQQRQ